MHRAKFSPYEWGRHSSLIFPGPGVSGSGRADTGPASTAVAAPALLSLAGGAAPGSYQGVDLLPCLAGRSSRARKSVFSGHYERNHLTAVRGERFKLIRNHTREEPLLWPQVIRNWQGMEDDSLRQPCLLRRPTAELHDSAADPLEGRNRAGDPARRAQRGELGRELRRMSV